ncbi:MAG TPA: hypothetical protein ENI13_01255 [candidate division CPR3 bacterium]|uniref:Uncharacterized protein n=1 Tax=candidate division CPR3 bacterium TaxID=2268181 RepID=A0A7C1NZI9_UNCC3|nr:hypothetical protein [candidate division CPR3 bacterium]
MSRHYLGLQDLTSEEINSLLSLIGTLCQNKNGVQKWKAQLEGRQVISLFWSPPRKNKPIYYDPDLVIGIDDRIQSLVNKANKALGISTLDAVPSPEEKIEDVIKFSEQLDRIDGVIIRHNSAGAAHRIARETSYFVLNIQDNLRERPVEALSFVYIIKDIARKLEKDCTRVKVGIVGNIAYSAFARSLIFGLNKLRIGLLTFASPTLTSAYFQHLGVQNICSKERFLDEIDFLVSVPISQVLVEKGLIPSVNDYLSFFQITNEDLKESARPPSVLPCRTRNYVDTCTAVDRSFMIDEKSMKGVILNTLIAVLIFCAATQTPT